MSWDRRGSRKGAKRLPEKLRRKVIARDREMGKGCYFRFSEICLGIEQAKVQVHHVVEAEDGGSDDEGNLVTACEPCHVRHSAIQSQVRSVRSANDWKRTPEKHPGLLG